MILSTHIKKIKKTKKQRNAHFSEQDSEAGFDTSHSTVKSLRSIDTGDVETVSLLHHKILLHKACKNI